MTTNGIRVIVARNCEIILTREFTEPDLTLAEAAERVESYVRLEQLNLRGDCVLKARFVNVAVSV